MISVIFLCQQQRFLPRMLHSRGHFPAPCSTVQVPGLERNHPSGCDSQKVLDGKKVEDRIVLRDIHWIKSS